MTRYKVEFADVERIVDTREDADLLIRETIKRLGVGVHEFVITPVEDDE